MNTKFKQFCENYFASIKIVLNLEIREMTQKSRIRDQYFPGVKALS